jgi:hypothetical protein
VPARRCDDDDDYDVAVLLVNDAPNSILLLLLFSSGMEESDDRCCCCCWTFGECKNLLTGTKTPRIHAVALFAVGGESFPTRAARLGGCIHQSSRNQVESELVAGSGTTTTTAGIMDGGG